ncbi:MAG: ligand-gated channel protein, partial [Proteobacteria bacterium]
MLMLVGTAASVPFDTGAPPAQGEGDAPYTVDDIVVTGSRIPEPAADAVVATEVITREEIERSGAANASDLLEEHPGIQVPRSFRGAGVRIQGLESKHILVLVDGVRVAGRIDGVVDLNRFTAEDIERVEIVKGPSSALYGSDAVGGVINIITRAAGDGLQAEARAAYGSFDSLDLSALVGGSLGDWSGRLSAGWHQVDSYDLDPSTPATSASGFGELNVAGRVAYALSKGSRVRARVRYL